MQGESPIASHLLYTQPTILSDDIPLERARGIEAGHAWKIHASKFVIYTDKGISSGMEQGIATAKNIGIDVEFRSLKPEYQKYSHDSPWDDCPDCRH